MGASLRKLASIDPNARTAREMQDLSRNPSAVDFVRFTVVSCWRLIFAGLVYLVLSSGDATGNASDSGTPVQFRDVTLAAGLTLFTLTVLDRRCCRKIWGPEQDLQTTTMMGIWICTLLTTPGH